MFGQYSRELFIGWKISLSLFSICSTNSKTAFSMLFLIGNLLEIVLFVWSYPSFIQISKVEVHECTDPELLTSIEAGILLHQSSQTNQ